MNRLFPRCLVVALTLVAAAGPFRAAAQAYPTKPVTIIVPLATGGTGDTLARLFAERLAVELGKPVIVENRPGSGGIIGTEGVAKSPPDGYSLIIVGPSHVINVSLRSKLPYNPIEDFTPIAKIADTPSVLVVHPSLPANTVQELIALAKAKPGTIHYGSAGNGSSPHLHAELFKLMAGIDLVHVPYKGSTQARTDLISGQVMVVVDGLVPSLPYIKAGKLRALGLTSAQRSPAVPELPTIAEAGVPGYEADAWYALLAPKGLPKAVAARIEEASIKALDHPELKARFAAQGAEVSGAGPDRLKPFLQGELVKWGKVVKASGMAVD
jgi:tripartite-type tricarboxylate transporter receptor subunit TctC